MKQTSRSEKKEGKEVPEQRLHGEDCDGTDCPLAVHGGAYRSRYGALGLAETEFIIP